MTIVCVCVCVCRAFVQKVRRPEVSKRIAPIQYGGEEGGEDRLHSLPVHLPFSGCMPPFWSGLGSSSVSRIHVFTPSFSRLTLGSSSRHKVFSILSQSRPLDDFASLSSVSHSRSVYFPFPSVFRSLSFLWLYGSEYRGNEERRWLQSLMGLLLDRGGAFKTRDGKSRLAEISLSERELIKRCSRGLGPGYIVVTMTVDWRPFIWLWIIDKSFVTCSILSEKSNFFELQLFLSRSERERKIARSRDTSTFRNSLNSRLFEHKIQEHKFRRWNVNTLGLA